MGQAGLTWGSEVHTKKIPVIQSYFDKDFVQVQRLILILKTQARQLSKQQLHATKSHLKMYWHITILFNGFPVKLYKK